MTEVFKNTGIIILAAGRGKRLNCDHLPKVLLPIGDKPIVSYVLFELENNGVLKEQISIVIGFQANKVKEILGFGYNYAIQENQLGTAHAAHVGEVAMPEKYDTILEIQGDDSAFYTFETLEKFVREHQDNNNDISVLTCELENPSGLGRIIRDEAGNLKAILEKEQITEEQAKIREVNTGTFCFKRSWFKEHYQNLEEIPGLGELGLPSFIGEAIRTSSKSEAIKLDNSNEWFGVNTPEQLEEADRRKRQNKS